MVALGNFFIKPILAFSCDNSITINVKPDDGKLSGFRGSIKFGQFGVVQANQSLLLYCLPLPGTAYT
jgi:hypothetical protein